jgi:hypothetical protein
MITDTDLRAAVLHERRYVTTLLQEGTQHATALIEARPSGFINTAKLNRDANIISGTTLITRNSSNGINHKRVYSEKALRQIAGMAEGLPAFLNHTTPDQAFKPRPVQDLIGRHVNVRYDPTTGKVLSDLHLVEHHAPMVFSLAERLGDQVGNSLVSKGLIKMEGDTEVVDDIVALRSADLVSDPASTKGLFESIGGDTGGDESVAQLRLPDSWQESGSGTGVYRHPQHGTIHATGSSWLHRRDNTIVKSGHGQATLSAHLKSLDTGPAGDASEGSQHEILRRALVGGPATVRLQEGVHEQLARALRGY